MSQELTSERGAIRAAVPADAEAVADLHLRSRQAAYAHFMPHSYLFGPEILAEGSAWTERLAGDAPAQTLVYEADGQILGFTRFGRSDYVDLSEDTGSIEQLYLD